MSAINLDNTARKYGFEQAIGKCLQLTGELCPNSIVTDIAVEHNLNTSEINTVEQALEDYLSEHDFF